MMLFILLSVKLAAVTIASILLEIDVSAALKTCDGGLLAFKLDTGC